MKNSNCILIVDDEIALCEILSIFFEMEGFKVFKANNGKEAIKVLEAQSSICFVISDVRMPDGDGVFLLNYIKKKYSAKTQVILLSGFTDYSEENLLKLGATAFFSKPIDARSLVEFVKSKL